MKRCTGCGRELPLSAFGKHSITKDGLNHQCKECNRRRGQKYRHTPEGVYHLCKTNAKHNSHKPMEISKEDFLKWYNSQERVCVYCGIKEEDLPKINDSMNNTAVRLTVDCVDNKAGYVLGNLVLSCRRCNNQKSDLFTFEEWYEIAQKYLKPKWERRIKDDKNE